MGARGWMFLAFAVIGGGCSCGGDPPDGDAGTGADSGARDGGAVADADAGRADSGGGPGECFPSGDYVESREATNDAFDPDVGSAEATSLVLADAPLTIGGCVGTSVATPAAADDDFFEVRVDRETWVRARLRWSSPDSRLHSIAIMQPDRRPVAWWALAGVSPAITAPVQLAPGTYLLHVGVDAPAPSARYAYELVLEPASPPCEARTDAPDFTEPDESAASHRANDVLSAEWRPSLVLATTAASDAPEATGLVVTPDARALIEGTSAQVPPDGDAYHDRDAFDVTIGEGVRELALRLDHATVNANLDVVIVDTADLTRPVATAFAVREDGDYAVATVEPGHHYLVWVAARDWASLGPEGLSRPEVLPVTYRLTLCGGGAP